MNISPNTSNTNAALQAQTMAASQNTEVASAPSKTIDFGGSQAAASTAANNTPALNTLFEQLSALMSQLLGKAQNNASSAPQAAYEVDPNLAVSNMTTTTGLNAENIIIFNEDGSALRGGAVDTAKGFSRNNDNGKVNHTFELANGTSIPRTANPDDVHARVEAYTSDGWGSADNETHTFKAQYDLGDVQDKTTIFQIKGPASPSVFAQVRRGNNPDTPETEGADNYYVFIAGRDRDLTEGQATRFNLKLEQDGTPAKFTLEAKSDGTTFSVKLQNDESTLVEGTHGKTPQTATSTDRSEFRWGLYNNSPANQDSTSEVNNIRISSKDT